MEFEIKIEINYIHLTSNKNGIHKNIFYYRKTAKADSNFNNISFNMLTS